MDYYLRGVVCVLVCSLLLTSVSRGDFAQPGDTGCAGGQTTSQVTLTVDRTAKRAQAVVDLPGGMLVISLDPLVNLVIHTLNMYDLLGLHGQRYHLKTDEKAREAIDSGIFAAISGKERHFGGGQLRIYSPTMDAIISGKFCEHYPDEGLLSQLSPEPFDAALTRMWREFYRAYWDEKFDDLLVEFQQMNANMRWDETLATMEELTGCSWTGTMVVFAVEATAESALKWGDGACIGTLSSRGDAGFVHEGLHLLLQERWAESPRIQEFMAGRSFADEFWGEHWQRKYEQALVVGLEIHLRKLADRHQRPAAEVAKLYFDGNMVGDLYDVAWPAIAKYVQEDGASIEELMLAIIVKAEGEREISGAETPSS
jgi:hypothetical protein